jgi:hypothetical protein
LALSTMERICAAADSTARKRIVCLRAFPSYVCPEPVLAN